MSRWKRMRDLRTWKPAMESPAFIFKIRYGCVPVTLVLEGRDRGIPGECCPASLVKMANFWFSERLCLSIRHMEIKGESTLHTCHCLCTHEHECVPEHPQACCKHSTPHTNVWACTHTDIHRDTDTQTDTETQIHKETLTHTQIHTQF